MNWYLEALRKYAQFDGRARRSEYWFFHLFSFLIYIALLIFGLVVAAATHPSSNSPLIGVFFVPIFIFAVGMIVPSLSVLVRRLHDTSHSGWWYFISFVPLVGPIILLIFICTDGDPGPNLYGPDPKGRGGYGQMYPIPAAYPPTYPPTYPPVP